MCHFYRIGVELIICLVYCSYLCTDYSFVCSFVTSTPGFFRTLQCWPTQDSLEMHLCSLKLQKTV